MSRCPSCGYDAVKLQERLESARARIEFHEDGPHKVPEAPAAEPPPSPMVSVSERTPPTPVVGRQPARRFRLFEWVRP